MAMMMTTWISRSSLRRTTVAYTTDNAQEAHWSAEAQITGPSYQARKLTFLLFINSRLVESVRLRRAVEAAYAGALPKGASPFVYVSLRLPPHTVDVNVHPTKREVHFLDEDVIIEAVADAIQAELVRGEGAKSRVFEYQVGGSRPSVLILMLTDQCRRCSLAVCKTPWLLSPYSKTKVRAELRIQTKWMSTRTRLRMYPQRLPVRRPLPYIFVCSQKYSHHSQEDPLPAQS
jgi:hypothetical protein